jgi:hypothetical protein
MFACVAFLVLQYTEVKYVLDRGIKKTKQQMYILLLLRSTQAKQANSQICGSHGGGSIKS